MSDASEPVTCDEHGETPATFACRHVTHGVACGYHANTDTDDRWPDAWCDACEEALAAAGGAWTEESEQVADIQLMCTHCYDTARARNETPPAHARGRVATLTTSEAEALQRHASREMQRAQEVSQQTWGWHTRANWNFDDVASTLTFTEAGQPTVVADVRLIGSFSTRTQTFQWAWETLDEAGDVAQLREFGEVRGLAKLTTANWASDEVEAWEVASLAGYLLGAEALYRAPFEHARWFMLLTNVRYS